MASLKERLREMKRVKKEKKAREKDDTVKEKDVKDDIPVSI